MAQLYRKTLLDKISSPEQLDKAVTLISPSFWVAAVGGVLIFAAVTVWALFARLPVTLETEGVYINRGGIHYVYSDVSGIVEKVSAAEGDHVDKDEVIAYIDSSSLREEIQLLADRRSAVEKITAESENDILTADTEELIALKNQKGASAVQFEVKKNSVLYYIDSEIEKCEARIHDNEIKASFSGTVISMNVSEGAAVEEGSSICRISGGDPQDMIVICYIPMSRGQEIRKGMRVMIYPSETGKQKGSHVEAEVSGVDSFVTSEPDMQAQLGDEALVHELGSGGAVTAVICELKGGPGQTDVFSGYSAAAIVKAEIILEEKTPFSILFSDVG